MEGFRCLVTVIFLTIVLHHSPSLGAAKSVVQRRESYVRIVHENEDDFCVARPQDTVVFCASPGSMPRLCDDTMLNFTRKMVVLQGPEGKCIGTIDGEFNREVNFDRSRLRRRLPILYGNLERCFAFHENGKWIELNETRRDNVFRIPRHPQPVSSSYRRNTAPWVRIHLKSVPRLLCVGRNGSEEVFCSHNSTARANCEGSSFINFDYRYTVVHRPFDTCFMRLSGYYDMLVELNSRSELDQLPVYDKDQGDSCVAYGVLDGAQENLCDFDGRRCRP